MTGQLLAAYEMLEEALRCRPLAFGPDITHFEPGPVLMVDVTRPFEEYEMVNRVDAEWRQLYDYP